MEYTQANKKREVAKKMGLTMHGKGTGYGGGMKYHGQSKGGTKSGGMKYKEHGEGTGAGGGDKPVMMNKKHSFSKNYTQNAN